MLVHIDGLSGSGKTTLGMKLGMLKGISVIDTDDIHDKFMATHKLDKKKAGVSVRDRMNRIINGKKYGEILLVVGILHLGLSQVLNFDRKFFIKVDPEIIWRQYNSRTLHSLCTHYKDIQKLLGNKNIDPLDIHSILSIKYGIRGGFDGESVKETNNRYKRRLKDARSKGYKVLPAGDIYRTIAGGLR